LLAWSFTFAGLFSYTKAAFPYEKQPRAVWEKELYQFVRINTEKLSPATFPEILTAAGADERS
jgi:hypothetical protein